MFHFIFRKKSTIFLLFSIIIISLLFSILLNQPLHEGLDTDTEGTMNNPPPDIINKVLKIIKDTTKETIPRLSEIREIIKTNYKVLGDIYRTNEKAMVKELTNALSTAPAKDSDGKVFDENALEGERRDKANKIISSSDYSSMEKIVKIYEMAGKDKVLTNIFKEYGESWLRMIKENVETLKASSNDTPKS